jgi:GTPase SAR1 family protein
MKLNEQGAMLNFPQALGRLSSADPSHGPASPANVSGSPVSSVCAPVDPIAGSGGVTAVALGKAGAVVDGVSSDLTEYESFKFELSDIVRFAAAKVSRNTDPIYADFLDFFARLGEDRFNVVMAGQFSRGKTSLMNAILGSDRLPTGVVPLTSAITSVGYGSSERVYIEFERGSWPLEIRMDEISQYITERGNPGNARGIRQAKVQLPAEILRRGFYFVDTPGLGSAIPENTRTAMAFLPEADVLVLVSGYDSPLSEDELRVLQSMANTTVQVFFVLNKQDAVAREARQEVIDYVTRQLQDIFGYSSPAIFSTSALNGLNAKLSCAESVDESGVPELEEALTRFLIENRRHSFLIRMCDRASILMSALAPGAETSQLTDRLATLRSGIERDTPNCATPRARTESASANPALQVRRCEICERINKTLFDFLCHYQQALVTDSRELARFAAHGGFCARHMWLYQAIAAPRDICVSLSPLLMSISARLRSQVGLGAKYTSMAASPSPCTEPACQLCIIQRDIESEAVSKLAAQGIRPGPGSLTEAPALCMPHLQIISRQLDNQDLICALFADQSRAIDRLTEDMRRYAMKYDGLRRALMSDEERRAPDDALAYLAGRRSIT